MTRKRYCSIEAKSLEDILSTCDRHTKNASMMLLDSVDAGDLTESDKFYCGIISETWKDLRDDVEKMLKERA